VRRTDPRADVCGIDHDHDDNDGPPPNYIKELLKVHTKVALRGSMRGGRERGKEVRGSEGKQLHSAMFGRPFITHFGRRGAPKRAGGDVHAT